MFNMADIDELPAADAIAEDVSQYLDGRMATADEIRDADNPILTSWDIFDLKTAYDERPPLREIVTGLLSEASLNIVFGAPSSLKSMLLLDLCVCIAGGHPWLSPLPAHGIAQPPLPTLQGGVLWIDFDNGRRRTHDRIAAVARAYNLPACAPLHYVSMPVPWLNASQLPMVAHLGRLIERNNIIFTVADNLGLIKGDTDENSAEMASVMGNLRWLVDTCGTALTLIHHQRKSGTNDDAIRKGETLRGHSSIEAALDLALHVDRKDGDQVAITPTKTRDALSFEQLGAMFTYEHRPNTRIMQTSRFYGYTVESKADREMAQIKSTVLDVVQTDPGLNQKTLVDAVRDRMAGSGAKTPGINKTRDAVRQLAEAGRIEVRRAEKDKGPQDELLHYAAKP